jgi:methanogenic corrinoid protein MtbC1/DNA-binding XRE family transcriptional regulator
VDKKGKLLVGDLRSRYLQALIDNDRSRAAAVVGEGLAHGLAPPTLLLDVLSPAQAGVGELWRRGELSPASALGLSVVVTTAPGEVHTVPARALSGLLRWRGWAVDYLGPGPPIVDLVDFVRQREPQLVALSITVTTHRPAAIELCRRLRRLESAPAILAGGAGVAGLAARTLEADAVTSDLREGLELALQLVGIEPGRNLESYLTLVGQRIQDCRHRDNLSQAELAERAGLTRPYLSAVERGHQNITLDAALKIAGALRMSVARLLDERPSIASGTSNS